MAKRQAKLTDLGFVSSLPLRQTGVNVDQDLERVRDDGADTAAEAGDGTPVIDTPTSETTKLPSCDEMDLASKVARGEIADLHDVEAFLSPYAHCQHAAHDAIMRSFGTALGLQRLFASLTPAGTRQLVRNIRCPIYYDFFQLCADAEKSRILTADWELLAELEGTLAKLTTRDEVHAFLDSPEASLIDEVYLRSFYTNPNQNHELEDGKILKMELTFLTERNYAKLAAISEPLRRAVFDVAHSTLSAYPLQIAQMWGANLAAGPRPVLQHTRASLTDDFIFEIGCREEGLTFWRHKCHIHGVLTSDSLPWDAEPPTYKSCASFMIFQDERLIEMTEEILELVTRYPWLNLAFLIFNAAGEDYRGITTPTLRMRLTWAFEGRMVEIWQNMRRMRRRLEGHDDPSDCPICASQGAARPEKSNDIATATESPVQRSKSL